MVREPVTGMSRAWQRGLLAWLCLLLPALSGADALDGPLEVRSAYVTVDNGVYQLNARVVYPLNDDIRGALKDGVSLSFDFEAQVVKLRRFWTNAAVVSIGLHRELSWHEVTERFVVRDALRGDQDSYPSLDQALQAIGSIDNWPVVVEPQLQADGNYEVSVRASVRRGNLSNALRSLIFWSDSWQRSSDWYSWSLPR
jgi:hypothetical protein